jgi:hypothetical protein
MSAVYIYGVVKSGEKSGKTLSLSVDGVAGGVRLLEEGELGAIVGAAPDVPLRDLTREQTLRLLVKHQETLEAAMAETTVLPVKFGAAAPDEAAVRRMLAQGGTLLKERLDEFAGRQQLEIVVTWELDQVFVEIGAEPDIVLARQAIMASGNGIGDNATRLEFGQKVKTALERRRAAAAKKIREGLSSIALDIAVNAVMDDRMVANFAVLLGKKDGAALDGALEALDADFKGSLRFRCVGPLPPTSFATVEVAFPSRQAIEQARQTLNIGGAADKHEIVSAFRQLARENHPDLGAAEEQGAERISQLSGAYRLLMAQAKLQGLDGDIDDDAPAVIIDVVRKEAPNVSVAL